MSFLLLPLAMFALAAPAQTPSGTPIVVTAHPWAPFISPMGEPFRAHSANDDTLADWFRQADRNHDGYLTPDEMVADAERFFGTLDTNHDGQIDPEELDRYEWEIAPEIQVNSRTKRQPGERAAPVLAKEPDEERPNDRRKRRGEDDMTSLGLDGALQGAARYGLLNIPEPVAAADTDFNRAISREEFRQAALARFQILDTAHQGRLSLDQLETTRSAILAGDHKRKHSDNVPDARVGNPLPTGP